MKKLIIKLSALVLIAGAATMLMIASCKKEEKTVTPAPPGNEFLTTTILTCINTKAPFDTIVGTWRDLTPDAPPDPDTSMAILNLHANTVYKMQIGILDETTNPVGDIGADILARGNYHLFCFTVSSGLNLTVDRTDHDTNSPPLPIGLQDNLTTTGASNGVLEVILRHQPNAKTGSCDPGSTDLDVNFQVHIN